jgi:hypothetical protein
VDHALETFVETTHATYGAVPVVGAAIVGLAALIALCVKFGTDDGDWRSPLVVGCGAAAVVVGFLIVGALPAAKADCKRLWKEAASTEPGPLGMTTHSTFSAYYTDNCPAIINCSLASSDC